jgi:hypothetical protein
MTLQKKKIEFLACDIIVMLTDSAPKGFRDDALAGVYEAPEKGNQFKVWFNGLITANEVVHECWHLFFTMMSVMDVNPKMFCELNDEIYAYSFHTLFDKVLDTITGMKKYKELYDREHKKHKKK